jgi:predicted cupin superfamily sugar epimerase
MITTLQTADYWREQLQLESHVEGGSFLETYRSRWVLHKSALPPGMKGNRNASTCIYFLLEYGDFSAFHRIAADEIWHFYDGTPLSIYEIDTAGRLTVHKLGRQLHLGEQLQVVITAGNWFAARVDVAGGFTLAGCTVAPGFDFEDFELAQRKKLQALFPQHKELIGTLTRED